MIAEERLRQLRVRDVMTRTVRSVPQEISVAEAAQRLRAGNVTAAPVVDAEGRCVGMVSASDLLRAVARHPDVNLHQIPVAEVLTPAVQSIAAEAPVLQAARIMCAEHIHRLPVLDPLGHPIGIISSLDIAAMIVKVMDEVERAR